MITRSFDGEAVQYLNTTNQLLRMLLSCLHLVGVYCTDGLWTEQAISWCCVRKHARCILIPEDR